MPAGLERTRRMDLTFLAGSSPTVQRRQGPSMGENMLGGQQLRQLEMAENRRGCRELFRSWAMDGFYLGDQRRTAESRRRAAKKKKKKWRLQGRITHSAAQTLVSGRVIGWGSRAEKRDGPCLEPGSPGTHLRVPHCAESSKL